MVQKYLSLVKFSHTIFALPFALIGFFLGYQEVQKLDWILFVLVLLCMVFARNAAMGFNRFLDREIDAKNSRTVTREIPAGTISPRNALLFVILNSAAFWVTTWFINKLCFFLAPVALLVILGYSFTKRFTALCHLVLGLGLSLAPVGAYLAVTGSFALVPVLLGVAVLTWVSGFDIIYALQDEEFDRSQKLNSIPVMLGKNKALILSVFLHLITAGAVYAFGFLEEGNWLFWIGAGVFSALLIYQHLLVKPNDLSRVNLAFFTTNGIASVVFASFVILDIFLAS
ncbi:MAG: UbiA family prenyltransferase [Bacteroidia bacterium]|nr:UbiA family prenyltransferase [Bacteroidia bacterium]